MTKHAFILFMCSCIYCAEPLKIVNDGIGYDMNTFSYAIFAKKDLYKIEVYLSDGRHNDLDVAVTPTDSGYRVINEETRNMLGYGGDFTVSDFRVIGRIGGTIDVGFKFNETPMNIKGVGLSEIFVNRSSGVKTFRTIVQGLLRDVKDKEYYLVNDYFVNDHLAMDAARFHRAMTPGAEAYYWRIVNGAIVEPQDKGIIKFYIDAFRSANDVETKEKIVREMARTRVFTDDAFAFYAEMLTGQPGNITDFAIEGLSYFVDRKQEVLGVYKKHLEMSYRDRDTIEYYVKLMNELQHGRDGS